MKSPVFNRILTNKATIAVILLLAGVVVGIQTNAIHGYNNYMIFKYAFEHLIQWENLYTYYPKEHFDLYLYSPTFAIFMAPFYVLPKWIGLIAWALTSCTFFYFALTRLPQLDISKKMMVFFIVLIEFITCIQNNQTNAIIISCMVLSFICFEKEKLFWAAFFIILPTSIKVFGLAAAALFLLYPGKGKFILYMLFWGIIFALAPIILIPAKQLWWQYQNWFHQLTSIQQSMETSTPHNFHPPLSLMGWLKTWFHINIPGGYFQVAGIVLVMIPFLRVRLFQSIRFRYFILSSLVIFTVIFNHIAESPTFVIAVFGAAIWFVWEKQNALTWALLLLMLIFTVLSPTDIFPRAIREHYVIPYVLKAAPCILIWFYIQYRLWFGNFDVTKEN